MAMVSAGRIFSSMAAEAEREVSSRKFRREMVIEFPVLSAMSVVVNLSWSERGGTVCSVSGTGDSSLTTPKLHPNDEDLSLGTPVKKALGAPCTQNDSRVFSTGRMVS